MLEQLLQYDKELFLFLNGLGNRNLGRLLDVHDHHPKFRSTLSAIALFVISKLRLEGNGNCFGIHCPADYLYGPTIQLF